MEITLTEKEFSDTNLRSGNLAKVLTECFRANDDDWSSQLSDLKLVSENSVSIHAGANWEATT